MQLRRLHSLTQRGDTIVEVLIAIAVISMILGGAFILTNRSLQGTRAAQERLNAIKLVEGQLEQVKNLSRTNHSAIFGGTTPASFCIDTSSTVKSASDASCKVNSDGAPATTDPAFNLSVSRAGNTFTVKAVWNSVLNNQDNIEMKYNVY
jgi:prepilin-type N-terminal cleavage/methylation domain-containing protein